MLRFLADYWGTIVIGAVLARPPVHATRNSCRHSYIKFSPLTNESARQRPGALTVCREQESGESKRPQRCTIFDSSSIVDKL